MMSYRAWIEEENYRSDRRVVNASVMAAFREGCDMRSMTFSFEVDGEEGDEPRIFSLPLRREVCPTCDGAGTHANPSIDAGGISDDDDFWYDDRDDDGESRYHSGAYDVTCQTCCGQNVVPVIARERADPETLTLWDEMEEGRAALEREYAAERRMGA
jgi:hypothetical protein